MMEDFPVLQALSYLVGGGGMGYIGDILGIYWDNEYKMEATIQDLGFFWLGRRASVHLLLAGRVGVVFNSFPFSSCKAAGGS